MWWCVGCSERIYFKFKHKFIEINLAISSMTACFLELDWIVLIYGCNDFFDKRVLTVD